MKIVNKTDRTLKLVVYSICPGKDDPIVGTLSLSAGEIKETEFPLDQLDIK